MPLATEWKVIVLIIYYFSSSMALRASATTSMLQNNTETIIGIYMGQEPIPYRHQLPGRAITLAQIKTLLTKKGPFRLVTSFISKYLPKFT